MFEAFPMKKKKSHIIRFADFILKALRQRQFMLYSSKYSKKVFTLHQHIVLLCVREYLHMGYERFIDFLPSMTELVEFIELVRIPHFTTLQKVAKRLKTSLLDKILLGFSRRSLFRTGIDSTGMSLHHSTFYYEKRLEYFSRKRKRTPGRPRKRRKKKHQYVSIFADLDNQIILSAKMLRGSHSDNPMMIPTMKKAEEIFDRIKSHDADRGYDAEYNHKYVEEIIGAECYIKLKNKDVPVCRTKGENRKKAKRKLHKKIGRPRKNHRNKMETIISVVKKVFGEHLTAIKAVSQRKQMLLRLIAYNAYRKAFLLIFEDF